MRTINTHFTRLIKAKDKLREYNFRKLPGLSNLFHVDVSDDRGNRLIFKMQKTEDSRWKIMDEVLPLWVYDSEVKLNEAIEDEDQHDRD